MPRIEAAGLPMTGLGVWRSTRCAGTALPFVRRYGSSVAACILRIKTINRVDLSALMAWSGRALPRLADPHRALADYRAIPAQDDGGRREENAPAFGQPHDAEAITERLREIV